LSKTKKQLVWHISEWERLYDVTPTREGSRYAMAYLRYWVDPRGGLTTRKEIDGRRQALLAAGGYELLGIFDALTRLAADQTYAYRGWLLNHRGQPASLAEIAVMLQLPPPRTSGALRKLASASVMAVEAMAWEDAQAFIDRRHAVLKELLTQDSKQDAQGDPDPSGGSERPPGSPSSPEMPSRNTQPCHPPGGGGSDGEKSSRCPAEKGSDQDQEEDQDQDLRLKSAVLADREDAGTAHPQKEKEEEAHAMHTEREPDQTAEKKPANSVPPPPTRDETERMKKLFSSPPVHPVIDENPGELAAQNPDQKASKGASKKGLNNDSDDVDPWETLVHLFEKYQYRVKITRDLCLSEPFRFGMAIYTALGLPRAACANNIKADRMSFANVWESCCELLGGLPGSDALISDLADKSLAHALSLRQQHPPTNAGQDGKKAAIWVSSLKKRTESMVRTWAQIQKGEPVEVD
jgi:hypothetical protein